LPNRAERELQKRIAKMTDLERVEYYEQERLEAIQRSYEPPSDSWPNRKEVGLDETNKNLYLIRSLYEGLHLIKGVYFVNNSNEVLRSIAYELGGWLSSGDESISVGSADPRKYEDVKSGEAVRLDFYHEIQDSDYMLQYCIKVILQKGEVLNLYSEIKKGAPDGEMNPK